MKLGEHLVEKGYLSEGRLRAALSEQKVTRERLGRILVRNGFLRQDVLVDEIRRLDVRMLYQESTILPYLPAELLIETQTMIVADLPDVVYAATLSNPIWVREKLRKYLNLSIDRQLKFLPASPQHIDEYLQQVEQTQSNSGDWLETMIRDGINRNVSDLHIMPRMNTYTILARRLGVREIVYEGELAEYNALAAKVKDRSALDMAERRVPQDGGFSIEHNGRVVDLRVATIPATEGEIIVIRLLDPDRVNPVLDKLGITRVDEFRKGLNRPDGLCLICGPTGSGKTTTLNAAIREMPFLEKSVYTIEDPPEYRMPYIEQVAVNELVGLDFSRGIRAFMRADPDVIIVGEIRDIDTARNALKAAETGHLVLGTLHTGSVHGSLERLRDIGIESHEIRNLLRAVMAQRLIRTRCTECAGGPDADPHCEQCHGAGYTSRTIISEVAYFSDEEQVQRVIDGQRWWPTMGDDVRHKVTQGITDTHEVQRTFGTAVSIDDLMEGADPVEPDEQAPDEASPQGGLDEGGD